MCLAFLLWLSAAAKADNSHWAFTAPRKAALPAVSKPEWPQTALDQFVLARLDAEGLAPNPEADPRTLLRRLSLDLIGLPPSPDEVSAFVQAWTRNRESAWASAVNRLLASPHFGEKWARWWMDLAHYADTDGYTVDYDRPHAWRWRDWVVEAFNRNQSFDQFTVEQIAGDLVPESTVDQKIATGFFRHTLSNREGGADLEEHRVKKVIDRTATYGATWLGLTVECAQCHEHKFDPISMRDYYRLQAFFARGEPGNVVLRGANKGSEERIVELVTERWRIFDDVQTRLINARRKKGYPEPILVIPKTVLGGMTAEERRIFDRLDKEIATLPQTWSYYSPATASAKPLIAPHEMRWPLPRDPEGLATRKTRILIRGDIGSPGPEVKPAWPAVFGGKSGKSAKTRLQLAEWLSSKENPLTARVWANRIWQWRFGRGLVETSGDFGTQGAPPSHPELLDWLAAELIDNDWSARHLHRLILGSNAYRQSSAYNAANAAIDPDNKLLWRRTPRRLEAEAIRDSILAVAGKLDDAMGGPSVPAKDAETSHRRSLYLEQKRDKLPHQQMLFDGANALTSCSRRRVSTVALQPLYLLNSEFMQRMAAAFAKRIEEHAGDEGNLARTAIELALSRPAREEEIKRAETLIAAEGLQSFCLALFNLNEFVYAP